MNRDGAQPFLQYGSCALPLSELARWRICHLLWSAASLPLPQLGTGHSSTDISIVIAGRVARVCCTWAGNSLDTGEDLSGQGMRGRRRQTRLCGSSRPTNEFGRSPRQGARSSHEVKLAIQSYVAGAPDDVADSDRATSSQCDGSRPGPSQCRGPSRGSVEEAFGRKARSSALAERPPS